MESSSTKGNIRHGKLKSQKELKRITDSEEYKKSDYEGKTKKLNVATANKGMSVGQAKIAAKAPPPNKIDAKDFAVLRAEKAKGRGQGLQDEKLKPGKVTKAALGILAAGLGAKKKMKDKKMAPMAMGAVGAGSMKMDLIKKLLGKKNGGMKEAKDYRKYLKGLKDIRMKNLGSKFLERRAKLAGTTVKGIERAAKATRIGKIAAGVAGAALLAKAGLEKMYEKRTGKKPFTKREPKRTLVDKKMGGGMMKKPMGYSKGMTMDDIVENMGKDYDYQTRIKYRKKSKGAPDQDPMKAYSEAEQDALKSVKKKYTGKMGGGMMQRPIMASKGKSVKVKCKLGRNKHTKMY